jgi:LysM repeat protein
MEVYQPERKRKGQARERAAARQRKQMATRHEQITEKPVMTRAPRDPGRVNPNVLRGHALVFTRDALWYLKHNTYILLAIVGLILLIVGVYLGTHVFGGRLFPNVWALNTSIGDLTIEEATAALQSKWDNSTQITLRDGNRTWLATPAQLGLRLNAPATVEGARAVGLAGVPFGYSVTPVVDMDLLTTQNFLLDLTEQTKILPYNAGYRWEGDQLVGAAGTDGRFLDLAATMANLSNSLALVAASEQFNLTMTTMPPDVRDPTPYLDQARSFAGQSFIIKGYDPFTDEHFAWTTDRATLTSWLEAHEGGLGLREDVFAAFVQAQTNALAQTNPQRYIEPMDSMEKMQSAIRNATPEVNLRIHYRPSTYTVISGDSGYLVSRRFGVPFYQLQLVNPGVEWEALSVGDVLNLPSPDITLPLDPVPNKRIVVNLSTQSLVAYENGEPVFSWLISSGMDHVPTSPGIYQIMSHAEKASGGSSDLCSDLGCAQWEMDWFMGIYEVVPGLMNGFHGAVLLATGRYLGDGQVGRPFTYGCIMSQNDNAKLLYDWAEEGTIVEIISPIYQPRSELGRRMLNGNAPNQA